MGLGFEDGYARLFNLYSSQAVRVPSGIKNPEDWKTAVKGLVEESYEGVVKTSPLLRYVGFKQRMAAKPSHPIATAADSEWTPDMNTVADWGPVTAMAYFPINLRFATGHG